MSRYETTVPWWSEGDAVCWTDSDGESVVIGLAANASDAQDICEARNADLADTPSVDDWTRLANDIRTVDGNHDLGAGELASRLVERGWRLADTPSVEPGEGSVSELEALVAQLRLSPADLGPSAFQAHRTGWNAAIDSVLELLVVDLPARVGLRPSVEPPCPDCQRLGVLCGAHTMFRDVKASLRADTPSVEPAGLSEAWEAAVAAFPALGGWRMDAVVSHRPGEWKASAVPTPQSRRVGNGSMWLGVTGTGPTPDAALRALAALLPTQASDSPEETT